MVKFSMPERLDVSNAQKIEKELVNLINGEKPDQLVCDFSQTNYISSAGLRVMLVMTKRMKSDGGQFILFKLQDQVLDVFKLAGFQAFMDIRNTLE